MKKGKYHILCSWILLVCFVAGQLMVYAHQHPNSAGTGKPYVISKTFPHQTLKEKCYLCDVMHHNAMMTSYQVFLTPVPFTAHSFNVFVYNFTAIQLIPTGGRAPPVLTS